MIWASKCFLLATWLSLGVHALRLTNDKSLIQARWIAHIAHDFEVIGPFPQEAREQHFLNPGYPLGSEIVFPLDYTRTYASHLADNGFVPWINSSVTAARDESEDFSHETPDKTHYSIQFPDIRWNTIRATEGWSGLQHHALLHTTIRIVPYRPHDLHVLPKPIYLLLAASQCSYIAILNSKRGSSIPQWHACNIYETANTPPIRVPLKPYFDFNQLETNVTESTVQALKLDVLISLDYEIRLFGDPTVSNDDTIPTIQVDLSAEVEQSFDRDVLEIDNILKLPTHETAQLDLSEVELSQRVPCVKVNPKAQVFPHFVDGWAFGNAVGIEMTSCSEENWSISDTRTLVDTPEFHLELTEPARIAPSQTRLISFRLSQTKPLVNSDVALTLELCLHPDTPSSQKPHIILVTIPIQAHSSFSRISEDTEGILLTYYSVSGTPASAVVLPPSNGTQPITAQSRILLALHGAGVMHTHPFWISALPRPEHTWVLVAQGLTPWGLDWREASRADVCAALRALVLQLVGVWSEDDYCTAHDLITETTLPNRPELPIKTIPVVAIGHSNGGQGSLHLASSFPDCIPALIPAAGYTSARLYVPTQASRGSLFADAALQGIIRASLQGQDGDAIASNLALSRVHLVHGGDDENVPVWHSRERMALIKNWNPNADVNLTEVPRRPHVWDTVFKDEPVSSAIRDLVSSPYSPSYTAKQGFTLTVAWPSESGSMRGWRIREADIPGRLSRIHVSGNSIQTTNVHVFSIELSKSSLKIGDVIEVDYQKIEIPDCSHLWLSYAHDNQWKIVRPAAPYPSGPLSSILISKRPIVLVVPAQNKEYYETIALRIAHNLYTYLKLDCTILQDSEIERFLEERSVVVIGGRNNTYGMTVRSGPLRVLHDGSISIGKKGTTELALGRCLYTK
ncbi:hypothetical protein RSOLAG1IB_05956 [Rhizoctonia solani AG-1 IB]|uniref:Peptidase S9 prolyl oligopeptidase catalytic domain-containing protein n=1 Tax=Thanatephorus cucumeris (strain AG1-IB / isolate 7/3/14) TaxID=1108050 RepID=A0A0B7F9J4_THACB|nr:hypothetical protein RSOLAG1IB_05956 [Rhizoctonia solani AG-1 IB]